MLIKIIVGVVILFIVWLITGAIIVSGEDWTRKDE